MQIDIRDEDDTFIDTIKFGEEEYLVLGTDGEVGVIFLKGEGSTAIYKDSIPDLIKALQKADELW